MKEDWLARLGEKDGRKTEPEVSNTELEVISSFYLINSSLLKSWVIFAMYRGACENSFTEMKKRLREETGGRR